LLKPSHQHKVITRPSIFWDITQRKLVAGYPHFAEAYQSPSSREEQQNMNAGNMQQRYSTGDDVGSNWFPEKVEEPIRLLAHEHTIKM